MHQTADQETNESQYMKPCDINRVFHDRIEAGAVDEIYKFEERVGILNRLPSINRLPIILIITGYDGCISPYFLLNKPANILDSNKRLFYASMNQYPSNYR
jgi:hypothetical protein